MPIEISTAENVSNLTWLVFAAASLLVWRYRVLPQLGSRSGRSLCALLCVLLLMFPIISISDDLHPDMVAAVEGESKSRLLKPADASRPADCSAWHLPLWALAPAGPAEWPALVSVERVRPVVRPAASRVEVFSSRFRGPPSSQLS